MLIQDILASKRQTLSFEFFPPKDDAGQDALLRAINELSPLNPAYVSVTYGAGGSTRERTRELAVRISRETGLPVVAHLTCVGTNRSETGAILENYGKSGIKNILALRGDPPRGETGFGTPQDGFAQAADLVAFIRKNFPEMGIGVAGFPEGHPATPNRLKEMDYLKAKVDAGADYIVTQLFFDNRDFYDFSERCALAGIRVPIVAGLMPVTSRACMERVAELAAGARIPAGLLRAASEAGNEAEVEQAGVRWAAGQACDLLARGARGLHLYTLNQAGPALAICREAEKHCPGFCPLPPRDSTT